MVSIEGIVPLFIRPGDLHVCTWIGTVENFAVDLVLGTLFMDRCIRGMFPAERKIFSLYSSQ